MTRQTLKEQTDARLRAAGFTEDDPAVTRLRTWNAAVTERSEISVETRRGQWGKTRRVTLGEAERQRQPVRPRPSSRR